MTFFMWLGAEAEEAACAQETLEQLIREALPVLDANDDE